MTDNDIPSPLRAAVARVRLREDVAEAAHHPGTPVVIRNTRGTPKNAQWVRAHEYRGGKFPYGLSMPPEWVEDAYRDADADAVCIVLRPGAPVPPATLLDRRASALVHAYRTGEPVKWPGGTPPGGERASRNWRMKEAGVRIDADGIVRRTPTEGNE